MKLSVTHLRRIIKEELESAMNASRIHSPATLQLDDVGYFFSYNGNEYRHVNGRTGAQRSSDETESRLPKISSWVGKTFDVDLMGSATGDLFGGPWADDMNMMDKMSADRWSPYI